MKIAYDFTSSACDLLLNPKIPLKTIEHVKKSIALSSFQGHILIASSGTTSHLNEFKLIALSKEAILASAKAVNSYLETSPSDVWLNPLPQFHVGGLGIMARAYLSKSKVIPLLAHKWDVNLFLQEIVSHDVTLTSLVPTQVYDLVINNIPAPKSLRKVLVGGGHLSDALYERAKQLNWPLIVSYGLTENSSTVATSTINSKELHFLSHVEGRIDPSGSLQLKSPALLTAIITVANDKLEIVDPKHEGWFTTEDVAKIEGNSLTILGRKNDFIKISGEGVFISSLEERLEEIKLALFFKGDAALIHVPDERVHMSIHLVTTSIDPKALVDAFNAAVMPYERIRKIHLVDKIPRTALNKLEKLKLVNLVKDRQKL